MRGSIQHITDDAKNLKAALDSSLQTDNSANINRITEAMRNLEAAWKALPNNQKFDINDRLTPKAQEMVRQFNELATASSTYGQTLSQIAGKIKRVADEEAKANQKRNDGYAKLRKTLGAQENSIANLSAKIKAYQQILNSKEIGSKSFERVAEKIRKLTEQLDKAKTKVAELTGKAQSGASRQAAAVRQVSQEFNKQDSYLANLLKKTAALWSIHQVGSFLTSVREVTAQFELQRVSLGAILQDQNKANQLFSEIKSFALKSPVSILDLTKYTKQLAAYKVGWDGVKTDTKELFEWTKKLTDVSVGLGVSMDRVVLAFGQVRATGYLRGCLGRGTSVKMFDGSNKKVEDVLVGDAIMGDDGQKRNVLSLVRNRETMYVVKFDGGSFRCNENHILTLYNINSGIVEDVYVLDYLKYPALYKGVKYTNGGYEYFDMSVERDCEDDYFGFEIDGNKRFIIEGNIVTHNSEVRQFTEMGVPIVEELAEKLKKLNGEAVTTEQVMDMISKRAISFDMVKEVFDDMTSAGGIFYNMQEKQGNTLYGMWAKLGDAASVMYEQIGNTGIVNEGMKEAIQMLTELMRNWKAVGLTAATSILPAVAAMAAWKMATKALAKSVATATSERIAAEAKLATAMEGTDIAAQNAARSSLAKAKADEAAAIAAQKNATAQSKLKMGFLSLGKTIASGLGIGIAVMLVTQAIYKFYEWITNIRKLKRELDSIYTETATLQDQSVRNFEFLADKAVHAAAGSKEQTDALQELNRTYRDILPQEALTIENLTKMKGKYDALTQSIREYIAEQQRQKAESAIMEYYGPKIRDNQNEVRDRLYRRGLTSTEVGRFFVEFERIAPESGKKVSDKFHDAMLKAGIQDEKRIAKIWEKAFAIKRSDTYTFKEGYLAISGLSNAYAAQAGELKGMNEEYRESIGNLGKFSDMQKRVSDTVANAQYTFKGGTPIDRETQGDLLDALKLNLWVKQTASEIQNNKDIKKAFAHMGEGIKSEWFSIIDAISVNDLGKVSQINFDAIIASVDSMIAKLGNKNPEILAILNTFRNYLVAQKKEYENMVPSETVVVRWRNRWRAIVKELQISGQNMNRFLMQSGEDFEVYRKRIKDEVATVIKTIKLLQDAIPNRIAARERGENYTKEQEKKDREELRKAEERKKALEKLLVDLDKISLETDKKAKGGGRSKSGRTSEDLRLQTLQETVSLIEKLYQEYNKYDKLIGSSKALEKVRDIYTESINMVEAASRKLGFKLPKMDVPTNETDLVNYLTAVAEIMKTQKGMKGGKKAWVELGIKIDTILSDAQQRRIESELKELADRISRTKTVKEFYEKVLGMTGDVELAANVAIHVYGEQGKDLNKQIREQIEKLLEPSGIKIDESIFREDGTFDPKKLREFAEAQKDALGGIESKAYQELIKLSDNADKDFAKTIEGWLKAIEKAKSASDKMLDLARTTRTEIDKITAQKGYAQTRITELLGLGTRTDEQQQELENLQGFLDVADKLIQGFKDKQTKEQTSLAYEMFKDSPMYVQMFDDLDHASTAMLENMKTRIEGLKGAWKDLTPTQLKELQSRMNEIDAQLAKRNPFKTLAKSISDYRKLRREGDSRGNKSEEAANADLIAASKAADVARKKYDELVKKYGEGSEKSVQEVIDAKEELDRAMANEEASQKAVENWKKVKDMIGLSANELFQMLNWAGDIAKGIADISEAMGADEEDVQHWKDVADALGQISGGIQDIVQSAMSGNVVGIISSALTAIPKMFVGFTNLFSAGKVKRANKEIKRQQQLLEQLEYTYGRLEAAADKVFGRDYLNNYNQQLKNLQAQQAAYEKQARAERSKGKKKDEEKIKEYENQARETADKIKELQDDLVAHFTGSSKTDVARQMANSWIEARASMSDTFAAIKGDYADMIKNMIVEGAAARVIENALTPVWDSMEKMLAKNDVQGAIDSLVNGMDSALNAANNGMEVLWKALEARGYDMKSLISDTDSEYTGMAKSVAGATSEEINNVAAIGNTLMYYVSPIPRIDENLARVVALMEGRGASAIPQTTSTGWTDWQQQAMDNYIAIQRNTADTVVECRRAANACEKMMKVIKTKGATSGFNVFLNA